MNEQKILQDTINWLERAVIGLNLCPFAKAVHVRSQIRYVVSSASAPEQLLVDLVDAIRHLLTTPAELVDTTLLIHPKVLNDFLDYNDFLEIANAALLDQQAEGILQIASFHPDYQFSDSQPDSIDNYTNRSPYPMLHLIREASIDRVLASYPDPDNIYERNIVKLRALGLEGWRELFS
jgi:hypothetical protein